MGNKGRAEDIAYPKNYDRIAITETDWDVLHHWTTTADRHRLFRRDRQGTRGSGVVQYVRECFDYDGDDIVESLWVRIREDAKKADMIAVCYRAPKQDENTDKTLFRHLGEIIVCPHSCEALQLP